MKVSLSSMQSFRMLTVVAVATVLSACATMERGKPEDVVAQRAQTYWDARLRGDMAAAYALTNPGYRKIRSLHEFTRAYRATSVDGAKVGSVDCEPDRCTVNMEFRATVAFPMKGINQKPVTIDTFSSSTWLLENGQWWLYMEP